MLGRMIRKFKVIIALAGMALLVFSSIAGATSLRDYPRVAVMNFGNKAITSKGFKDQDFTVATEYAIYQLSASGWFDLIDYETLNTIAQMHNINNSGLVDPATIVEMGKFAGVEYIIVGNVTGLTLKENTVGARAKEFKGDVGEHVVNASVAVRIVDIKTGRIMAAGIGKGSSTSTKTEIGFIKDKWVQRVASDDYTNSVKDEYNVTDTIKKDGNITTIESSDSSSDAYSSSNTNSSDTAYTLTKSQTPSVTITNEKKTEYTYVNEAETYSITIGTEKVSEVQALNAISKAIRDAFYGKMGLLTTLNGGKQLDIKTGF